MKKVYVVCKGRKLGAFDLWADYDEQVECYRGAIYKSFMSLRDTYRYIREYMPAGERYVIRMNGRNTYCSDYSMFIRNFEELIRSESEREKGTTYSLSK